MISDMIVDKFHGSIRFISKENEGSTFTFSFKIKIDNQESTIVTRHGLSGVNNAIFSLREPDSNIPQREPESNLIFREPVSSIPPREPESNLINREQNSN